MASIAIIPGPGGAPPPWSGRAGALAQRLARLAGRASPLDDIQRVFALLPPDSAAGESLFRLAEALPRTPDAGGRVALLRERVPGLRHRRLAGAALPLAELAIRAIAGRFVYAETIGGALARARRSGLRTGSFDMLGEGARTRRDALANLKRYREAVAEVGAAARRDGAGGRLAVSVKLSAIHPRHDAASHSRVRGAMLEAMRELCRLAAARGVGLTVDAEESWRVPLQLDLLAALALDEDLLGWPGLGLALQAYRSEAARDLEAVLAVASRRAEKGGTSLQLRLVKGAYWDAEVKHAQEQGADAYPVHTDKRLTDRSYLACAERLLRAGELVHPQFATHNPVTAGCVLAMAEALRRPPSSIEFQRLHGMGRGLEAALGREFPALPVRLYAPVGERHTLLAYLVRRLIENGASTSFLRRAARDGQAQAVREALEELAHPAPAAPMRAPAVIPPLDHPEHAMPQRRSARGRDLADPRALTAFAQAVAAHAPPWRACPIVDGAPAPGRARPVRDPARAGIVIGEVVDASPEDVERALACATAAAPRWAGTAAAQRAAILERAADALEADTPHLAALCVREAGKTLADALADVREAVDFCRYYAAQARRLFGAPLALPGPAGESNQLSLHGRGVFACISPWNFPVAIFAGQVAAALAAGNAVVAKPAEQTPLAAHRVVQLLHRAGVPPDALHVLPGDGETVGRALVRDRRIDGIAFTGGNETASAIHRDLAARGGPIVPLIAETGGLNAMIADSTALPEQVVDAVVASAFRSAGQRCSSLRILYLQDEIADPVIAMLHGAVATLRVGDPMDPATDVGPVIDAGAQRSLLEYIASLRARTAVLAEAGPVPAEGHYVAPVAFAVGSIRDLPGERFGPVLHVARFSIADLDRVVDEINACGFGLTMGLHTRVEARVARVRARARVGNLYVNRNMIGAVVGVQPFGGEGLSGTGPKAGGPHYLLRFATERVLTVNTAAAGGDLELLTRRGPAHLP